VRAKNQGSVTGTVSTGWRNQVGEIILYWETGLGLVKCQFSVDCGLVGIWSGLFGVVHRPGEMMLGDQEVMSTVNQLWVSSGYAWRWTGVVVDKTLSLIALKNVRISQHCLKGVMDVTQSRDGLQLTQVVVQGQEGTGHAISPMMTSSAKPQM